MSWTCFCLGFYTSIIDKYIVKQEHSKNRERINRIVEKCHILQCQSAPCLLIYCPMQSDIKRQCHTKNYIIQCKSHWHKGGLSLMWLVPSHQSKCPCYCWLSGLTVEQRQWLSRGRCTGLSLQSTDTDRLTDGQMDKWTSHNAPYTFSSEGSNKDGLWMIKICCGQLRGRQC